MRISSHAEDGRTALDLADVAEAAVLAQLAEFVWARGDISWAGAIAEALDAHGWTLATVESGTGGSLVGLLRGVGAIRRSEVLAGPADPEQTSGKDQDGDLATADAARAAAGADVGIAVRAIAAGDDTAVHVAVVTPDGRHAERRLAFMRGSLGADRAAIASAAVLLGVLRDARSGPG